MMVCCLKKSRCVFFWWHSGIGMVNTAFTIGRLTEKYPIDLIVNIGIAGAIDRGLALGEIVEVTQDCFSEMGAETADNQFLDLEKMGFSQMEDEPVFNQMINETSSHFGLNQVRGITVNKVHGSASGIQKLSEIWPKAQVESMEGAAVFLTAKKAGIPCLQFRAISNYVEPRNKDAWNIPLALRSLGNFLQHGIDNHVFSKPF